MTHVEIYAEKRQQIICSLLTMPHFFGIVLAE